LPFVPSFFAFLCSYFHTELAISHIIHSFCHVPSRSTAFHLISRATSHIAHFPARVRSSPAPLLRVAAPATLADRRPYSDGSALARFSPQFPTLLLLFRVRPAPCIIPSLFLSSSTFLPSISSSFSFSHCTNPVRNTANPPAGRLRGPRGRRRRRRGDVLVSRSFLSPSFVSHLLLCGWGCCALCFGCPWV